MPFDCYAARRAIAAIELRLAGSLRRDLMAGHLGRTATSRAAAVSAIRDHLRQGRACTVTALIMRPYAGRV